MATPIEIRKARLANDYEQMKNIRGNIVSWRAVSGIAPYIETYELNINLRTIVGIGTNNNPKYRSAHTIRISLPPDYPFSQPEVVMTTSPFVFHPNFFRSGKWCPGNWSPSESLGYHIIRMLEVLNFDPSITKADDAANSDAKQWYESRINSGLFPCNSVSFPDPDRKKLVIKSTQNNQAVRRKVTIKNR